MQAGLVSARAIAFGLLILIGIAKADSDAFAQQLTCGAFYRVQSGDTLRAITVRAYGHDRYQVLFNANRDVLPSAAKIEIGQLLYLPCQNTGPQTRVAALSSANVVPTPQDQNGGRAAASAPVPRTGQELLAKGDALPKRQTRARKALETIQPEIAVQTAVAVITPRNTSTRGLSEQPRKPVLLLSAGGFEPMAGPDLEAGGLVGALIQKALNASDAAVEVKPAFVNDRQAHLKVLLPLDTFGLSYPWPVPNCAGVVGKHSQTFCSTFEASLPIFQVEMQFLARKGGKAAQLVNVDALASIAICRPQDFPPYDLERQNMRRIIVAEDLEACLMMLSQRKVDVVSAPAAMIDDVRLDSTVVEIEALRSQEPVHAIFTRKSERSARLRNALNEGLRKLQSSGAWFSIVSRYLGDYNATRVTVEN